MGAVRFDRSRWPIVVAELEGKPTDDDVEAYLRGLATLLQEDARGVLVIDMTRADTATPEQRRRVGEWMRANRCRTPSWARSPRRWRGRARG